MKSILDKCYGKVRSASQTRSPMSTKESYQMKRALQDFSNHRYKLSQWKWCTKIFWIGLQCIMSYESPFYNSSTFPSKFSHSGLWWKIEVKSSLLTIRGQKMPALRKKIIRGFMFPRISKNMAAFSVFAHFAPLVFFWINSTIK